jgi:hypothetical protein
MLKIVLVNVLVLFFLAGNVLALGKPDFISIKKKGSFELRHYPHLLVADVTVSASSLKEAGNKGFKVLSHYIFKNPEQKIKMTAPVIIETQESSQYRISFVMPKTFTKQTLPKATSPEISFRELTDLYVVAVKFSGKNSIHNFMKYEEKCRVFLLEEELKISLPVLYAYYSPPFVPSFLRKHEVLYSYKPVNE